MTRKRLAAAISLALAGSAGAILNTAQAVHINPDGIGEVLIYPYYTVRSQDVGQTDTLLSVVNTTSDFTYADSWTTLREAIIQANANPGPDVIEFNLSNYIDLEDQERRRGLDAAIPHQWLEEAELQFVATRWTPPLVRTITMPDFRIADWMPAGE